MAAFVDLHNGLDKQEQLAALNISAVGSRGSEKNLKDMERRLNADGS